MDKVKILCKSIREYKKPSFLSMFYVLLEVICEVSVPFLMSMTIDNGIKAGNQTYTIVMCVVMMLITLLGFLMGVLAGFAASKASCGFSKNLRSDMYKKIQTYSFNNIDKFSTASIVTRLTTDSINVQNAYIMIIRTAIRAPIMLVAALVLSFINNYIIGLCYLVMAIILGFLLIFIASKAHPYFQTGVTTYDDLNGVVQENLQGIRVVKSFVTEDKENGKFQKISNKIFKLMSSGERVVAFNNPVVQFVIYVMMLLLSYFGARFIVVDGTMTTGQLSSSISYAWMILNTLIMISMIFVNIIIARTSVDRIVAILTEESDIVNNNHPIKEVKDGSVEFNDVTFFYAKSSEKPVLDHVSFKIKSGQTVGIVGGTGSSKSSLISLIARLYDVTSGEVKVGGINVKDYDLTSLRDKVSVVLQKNTLFSGSIKENLRWGKPNATDKEIVHACELAQAAPFIEQFPYKYDTYIEQGGTNVSGGQKQRLCIARALLKSPDILILDDSTSAVDTKTDSLIRKAFKEDIPNVTKFIVAQRISSVEDADVILVLDDGKLVNIGNHEQLLKTSEIYTEMYNTQTNKGVDENGK